MSSRNLMRFIAPSQVIFQICVLLCVMSAANAKPYFQDCKAALAQPSFHLLKEYLDNNGQLLRRDNSFTSIENSQCYQKSDTEFGVVTPNIGVFYCGLQDGKECEYSPYEISQPNLRVVDEFDGYKDQHFVLLETNWTKNSEYVQTYEVLYLSRISYPFAIQELTDGYGLVGESCNPKDSKYYKNWFERSSIYFQKHEYHVEHAGQQNMSIVFNLMRRSCKTLRRINYQERYVFRDNHFIKVS